MKDDHPSIGSSILVLSALVTLIAESIYIYTSLGLPAIIAQGAIRISLPTNVGVSGTDIALAGILYSMIVLPLGIRKYSTKWSLHVLAFLTAMLLLLCS